MRIILGIGGGIAAYKSAELARLLMERGHQVQAVMTPAAQEFVRPLTFAALTGRKVLTDLFAIERCHEACVVGCRRYSFFACHIRLYSGSRTTFGQSSRTHH